MYTGVVIVAAGSGKRMGAGRNKLWLTIDGKSILAHTVERFATHPEVEEVVLVVSEKDEADVIAWLSKVPYRKKVSLTLGGAERQDSVRAGLAALSEQCDYVLVHDAARPFVTKQQITEIIAKVQEDEAVVMAVPVKDTIKVVNRSGIVEATPARESLWAVQTPQAFRLSLLREAHQKALLEQIHGTDCATLVEWLGFPVKILAGSYENIKITTPDDIWFGEEIMRRRRERE
ncbi:MAG: 2-C-methyl-D-erythritol 4-phosphate cytidylyltransferase [Brevibacillus sp.]|nr:2-C-methyl-D-erythritol 4-phosphate cytidylyltransferase [Brevibacillus sp.]